MPRRGGGYGVTIAGTGADSALVNAGVPRPLPDGPARVPSPDKDSHATLSLWRTLFEGTAIQDSVTIGDADDGTVGRAPTHQHPSPDRQTIPRNRGLTGIAPRRTGGRVGVVNYGPRVSGQKVDVGYLLKFRSWI